MCLCVCLCQALGGQMFLRLGVPEGKHSQADGEGSSWKFRNLHLHSFVQFSNNPDKFLGPDGWFIQPCWVTFCMQMKCPLSHRALGRVQTETACSAQKVINVESREETMGG